MGAARRIAFITFAPALVFSAPLIRWPIQKADLFIVLQWYVISWVPTTILVGAAHFRNGRLTRGGALWLVLIALVPLLIFVTALFLPNDVAMRLFFPEDTIYARQFNEVRFAGISLGMTKSQVISQLGSPLSSRSIDGTECWYYSAGGPWHKNYRNRAVLFAQGHVKTVVNEFHTDR